MRNKRKLILILFVLTALLAACAPVVSGPEPGVVPAAGAAASVTLAASSQDTDANAGPDSQPLPAPPAAETPQPVARGRVNEQGLNLRAGPSINHVIFGQLGEGTELEIQGRSENLEWLLVKLPGGREGWVYSGYVDTQVVIADLPLKEAYGGPDLYPSSGPQDVRQPLNVQVSIENDLAIVYVAGFPGDSKVIARLGEVGEAADLYVGESVTTANGNAVIRFTMPSLNSDKLTLVVSSADSDVSVDVRVQYFHN
ncbi:MAG TPA: SH3 domain-containing protein [Anaerolineales bacterium]|nr:SH3 domain-containing protein [Anaerolineales bacterium]